GSYSSPRTSPTAKGGRTVLVPTRRCCSTSNCFKSASHRLRRSSSPALSSNPTVATLTATASWRAKSRIEPRMVAECRRVAGRHHFLIAGDVVVVARRERCHSLVELRRLTLHLL